MTAVVCHDAGGAEIVSSYVRRHKAEDYAYGLEGPAKQIFERKLGILDIVPLERVFRSCSRLIAGTGWHSDLEWRAVGLARKAGVHSIAFLDHWTNYEVRFVRNGITHLPDEIWVGDQAARDIATGIFSSTPVHLVDNPYLLDLKAEMTELRRPSPAESMSILYVCEPIEDHVKRFGGEVHYGYNEYDALRFFLSKLDRVMIAPTRINIRRHPAEPEGKYEWAAREFPDLPIVFSKGETLLAEVAEADVVAGCETMAMVVALTAGKRVVSSVPPGGKPCALPHREIEKLADIAARA